MASAQQSLKIVPKFCTDAFSPHLKILCYIICVLINRSGPFECYPELISYKGSLRRTRPARVSPMSHDIDDSQPPSVSYTAESVHSSTESEEEEGGAGGVSDTFASQQTQMDWEHLEPSAEEVRLFEEEQMKLALAVSPTSDRVSVAHKHAQEVENYRQRLRRLDYNTTYMDYAAHAVGPSPFDSTRTLSADGTKLLGSSGEGRSGVEVGGERTSVTEGTAAATSPTQQGVASGILGTLSSLWTSTFGGSKS